MRTAAKVAIILGLMASACWAQAAQESAAADNGTVRFKSRSSLVIIPVIVHHKDKHVAGLKKEDFTVLEDGKEKQIESFEEVRSRPSTRSLKGPSSISPTEFTNVNTEGVTQHFTIIALRLSNDIGLRKNSHKGILDFLRQNVIKDPIALVAVGDGIRLIHDFSTDTAILAASLEGAQRGFAISEHGNVPDPSAALPGAVQTMFGFDRSDAAGEMQRVQDMFAQADNRFNQLQYSAAQCDDVETVRMLARALAGVPGRKSLIWVAGSSPLNPPTADNLCMFKTEDALLELANANMAIYTVNARGLEPMGGFLNGGAILSAARNHGPATTDPFGTGLLSALGTAQANMDFAADATGGKSFKNSNELSGLIERANEDSAEYYQLTYRLDSKIKPGWHKLKVQVNQPHVEVRTRSGFLVRKAKTKEDAEDLRISLGSPFMQTEIPVLVTWIAQSAGYSGARHVAFRVSVPGRSLVIDDADRNHVSLSLTGVALSAKSPITVANKDINGYLSGASLAKFSQTGINYHSEFEVPPGHYEVKFAIRDNVSGKVGTVFAELDAK